MHGMGPGMRADLRSAVNWRKPENMEQLQRLLDEGLSYSQIAARLCKTLGQHVSRGAVSGAVRLSRRRGLDLASDRRMGRVSRINWQDPDVKDRLVALWRGGGTYAEMAEAFDVPEKKLKNAIYNAGLHKRFPRRVRPAAQQEKQSAPKPRAGIRAKVARLPGKGVPDSALPENINARFRPGFAGQQGRVALEDLQEQHCRFPIDQEDGPLRYCGLPHVQGSRYCAAHAARCTGRQG